MVNRVIQAQAASTVTLGIGLRVVAALLKLEGGIRFQLRRSPRLYAVRLVFISTSPAALDREADSIPLAGAVQT